MTIQLRDYQQDWLDAIRASFRARHTRVLGVLPTGGGKTVCFSYMARAAASRGNRVCIVVHRRELLRQTVASLGVPCGIINPGFTPDPSQPIQVATAQTLVNRLHNYQFDLIIPDEAHHAVATTYLRIFNAYPRARILGVTATPIRMAGMGLGDLFDDLIIGPSVSDLTAMGHLCPARVYAPSTIDTSGLSRERGDFARGQLAAACDKPTITGDAIQHYRRYADGQPAIAFCASVLAAEHTAEAFRLAGYRSMSVDGKTPQDKRDGAIRDLGVGRLDVITSCDLISEGVDVPVVSCGIMLRPTYSTGLAIQQMGRCLRVSPGKTHAVILDHAGNCLRHGLPNEDREWSLEKGEERTSKRDAEQDVRAKQCPTCYYVHEPAPACPSCGHVYAPDPREVARVEGELALLETRRQERREIGRARTREDLERIAHERGYKPGWVHAIMRARGQKTAVGV